MIHCGTTTSTEKSLPDRKIMQAIEKLNMLVLKFGLKGKDQEKEDQRIFK